MVSERATWPLCNTVTSSAKFRISDKRWETKRMPIPFDVKSFNSFPKVSTSFGPREEVGSSNKR